MSQSIRLRGEGGSVFTMDLPLPEVIQQRLDKGYLRRVEAVEAVEEAPVRPAKSAPKAEWIGWAVRVHGLTPDDAEAMTKDDLQELPDEPEGDTGGEGGGE